MDVTALLQQKSVGSDLIVRTLTAQPRGEADHSDRTIPVDLDDAELARRVARQDREAATLLVNRYQASLRTFLGRICVRQDLADDLAQETFVRMLRYAHRYDGRYPMKTWLFTIARRLLINHLRDHGRTVEFDQVDGHEAMQDGPAELAVRKDQHRRQRALLDRAIAQLTATQRQVLMLFYHQEQSVEAIARQMQMPHGTVKSHLHRARTTLRKLLAPHWEATES